MNFAPVITVPPVDVTYELGSGAAAYTMTVTDANADTLTVSFASGNTALDACCSVSDQGADSYDVDCTCSDLALYSDTDVAYTVTLVANDGTVDSASDTFVLTISSLNKLPEFTGLSTALAVDTNTNPYTLNLNYRDLNIGDTLTFTQNIVDPAEAATLASVTSTGDSADASYSYGGQDLVFDFTDYVGTVTVSIDVTDDNSAGGSLGNFNDAQTIVITVADVATTSNLNFPPYFKFNPEPIELDLLETYALNLTFWVDVDETDLHVVTVEFDDSEELPDFIEYDGSELLEIRPKSPADSGYYVLKVTVTDDNSNDCTCGEQSDTIFLVLRIFEELQDIDFMEIFGEIPTWEPDPLETPEMRVTELTNEGLLTITFTHELLVPRDPYKVITMEAL